MMVPLVPLLAGGMNRNRHRDVVALYQRLGKLLGDAPTFLGTEERWQRKFHLARHPAVHSFFCNLGAIPEALWISRLLWRVGRGCRKGGFDAFAAGVVVN